MVVVDGEMASRGACGPADGAALFLTNHHRPILCFADAASLEDLAEPIPSRTSRTPRRSGRCFTTAASAFSCGDSCHASCAATRATGSANRVLPCVAPTLDAEP